MESSYSNPRSYGPQLPAKLADIPPPPDNDRTTADLRALDCNLTSLCDHIITEGFTAGSFSDIVVRAMGSTYHLHRLILSRSSYFRNMLHGPWKEAGAPIVTLQVDDKNVNEEAIAISLAYLYGHHPKLNDNNAFRVLAAASFLDLQDLCAICTDFIISELWTSNFLAYQVFAENQDYGIHGERVRNACWGYLCQSGAVELKEVLPKLSSHTLHALLTSDELWVPSEEKRFELALYALLAKGALNRTGNVETVSCDSDSSKLKGKNLVDNRTNKNLESKVDCLSLKDDMDVQTPRPFAKLQDCAVDLTTRVSSSEQLIQHPAYAHTSTEPVYPCDGDYLSSLSSSFADSDGIRPSCSYVEVPVGVGTSELMTADVALEGPSEEGSCYHLNNSNWIPSVQSMNCSSMGTSCNGYMLNDWGRCSMSSFSWGGRVVGKRQVKSFDLGNSGVHGDEHDTFFSIFEGGSLLYCSMTFDALLNVKNQLEELGFPCKAVNDGLWLQTLLRQRVQEAAANTCKSCCLTTVACACRQPLGLSHGVAPTSYYMQDHDQNNIPGNMTGVYVQGDANGIFRPVRVHVRGRIDGLAGIGRRTAFAPAAGWPPTRFVFSRVPFGMANRSGQQSLPYDDSEARGDRNGDVSGDGLTALVGLSQGGHNSGQGDQIDSRSDMDQQSRFSAISASAPTSSCISMQMMESPEHSIGIEWENENNSISLDLKTPLSHFPPFRFGVEFEDVHRLCDGPDGQVKHSAEFFYAGSLWKISVQAFNDEDPQGRRTLGLFLHRRKAELTDAVRKVHIYVDSREKVTARYQLICPSKREVMVFGSFKQRGTLLPKAPKGWGWRTALLFDELADLLQNGALRVAAVVQLVEN